MDMCLLHGSCKTLAGKLSSSHRAPAHITQATCKPHACTPPASPRTAQAGLPASHARQPVSRPCTAPAARLLAAALKSKKKKRSQCVSGPLLTRRQAA